LLKIEKIEYIFPEYYILKVGKFDNNAKDSLDEWIYFLKNSKIKDSFTAKGLKKAKKEFDVLSMKEKDRVAYNRYQSNKHYEASMIFSSYGVGKLDGVKQGIKQGIEQGIEQEKAESQKKIEKIAKNSLAKGIDIETIALITGLSVEEIKRLDS